MNEFCKLGARGALAAVLVLSLSMAGAQSSKPVTAAKVDVNKVMSKDELRICMKLKAQVLELTEQLQQRKSQLSSDKASISEGSGGTLKPLRAELEASTAEYKAADAAVIAHAKVIDQWNDEVKALDESTMKAAERQKKKLLEQRKELESKNKGLLDDRDSKSKAYAAMVERYNQAAKQVQSASEEWNKRNETLVNDGDKLIEMRANYAAECGNRRFKEDDEAAIKAGK